ncbi:hypothetical protein D3C74_444090 [compost metagenome]
MSTILPIIILGMPVTRALLQLCRKQWLSMEPLCRPADCCPVKFPFMLSLKQQYHDS